MFVSIGYPIVQMPGTVFQCLCQLVIRYVRMLHAHIQIPVGASAFPYLPPPTHPTPPTRTQWHTDMAQAEVAVMTVV